MTDLLPLRDRQRHLERALYRLHVDILRDFAERGAPPDRDVIATRTDIDSADAALKRLADDDLVVLAPDGKSILGAYPFTLEPRSHRVALPGHAVHAMCALDALSIAPMFATTATVLSVCHVTGAPIEIDMDCTTVKHATPAAPYVGIRWQSTSGCAAQSLCLEMLFLADKATADTWRQKDAANMDILDLASAIKVGAAFFRPLLIRIPTSTA